MWYLYYTFDNPDGAIDYIEKEFYNKEEVMEFIKSHITIKGYHNFRLSEFKDD